MAECTKEERDILLHICDTNEFFTNDYFDDEAKAEENENVNEFINTHKYHELYTLRQLHYLLEYVIPNIAKDGSKQLEFISNVVFAETGMEDTDMQKHYSFPPKIIRLCSNKFDILNPQNIYWDNTNNKPYIKQPNVASQDLSSTNEIWKGWNYDPVSHNVAVINVLEKMKEMYEITFSKFIMKMKAVKVNAKLMRGI